MGGTEIYNPLNKIFQKSKPADCDETNIFLLTDGAVGNTQGVIDLVKRNSSNMQRVHTFGIGSGASQYLITECAK